MSAPALLSQRMREAVDFGPVKYGHAGYVEKLMALVGEVAALEAWAQTVIEYVKKTCYRCQDFNDPPFCRPDFCELRVFMEKLGITEKDIWPDGVGVLYHVKIPLLNGKKGSTLSVSKQKSEPEES